MAEFYCINCEEVFSAEEFIENKGNCYHTNVCGGKNIVGGFQAAEKIAELRVEVERLREQIICYEGECDGVNCSNCGTINKVVDDEV